MVILSFYSHKQQEYKNMMKVKIDILHVMNSTCTYHEKLSFGDHFSLSIIITMYFRPWWVPFPSQWSLVIPFKHYNALPTSFPSWPQWLGFAEVALYHEDFSAVHLFLKKNNLFFWLCWVFIVARGFSLVVASRGHSLVVVQGLLTAVASLVGSTGSRALGLQ